jgi:hypothetical protein
MVGSFLTPARPYVDAVSMHVIGTVVESNNGE